MANSNEYMREYMQKRRATRRQQLIDLLGKKCWNCGSTQDLEFNHLDPKVKSFTLSGKDLDKAWNTLLAEVEKCELLCRVYHLEVTREQYARGDIVRVYPGRIPDSSNRQDT